MIKFEDAYWSVSEKPHGPRKKTGQTIRGELESMNLTENGIFHGMHSLNNINDLMCFALIFEKIFRPSRIYLLCVWNNVFSTKFTSAKNHDSCQKSSRRVVSVKSVQTMKFKKRDDKTFFGQRGLESQEQVAYGTARRKLAWITRPH